MSGLVEKGFLHGLPPGSGGIAAIVGNEGLYNLQASEDADLVSDHKAMVTVKGPTGIGVSQPLMITVEKQE